MPNKTSEYWARRMEMIQDAQLHKGEDYLRNLEKYYIRLEQEIESKISTWYQRYATNNSISMTEAKQILTSGELREFRWSVEEYIQYGKENAISQEWIKELENASTRVHVNRLESLRYQLQQQVEVLYGNQIDDIDNLIRNIYQDGYNHIAYEIQKGFSIGYSLSSINNNQMDKIISKPWTYDGKTFSDRIWTNKQTLINNLQTNLTQSVITGKSSNKIIKEMSKSCNTDKSKVSRLVMTESAAFSSRAQEDAYKELSVKQYEIIATLDLRTSEVCQSLDGHVFEMSEYAVGSTAPPFHCYCRTATAPHFEDDYGERIARSHDGKTYFIPSDMKYKEWYEKYVKNDPDAIATKKKLENLDNDKKQYKKYKQVLGKEYVPNSFEAFRKIKYTDEYEYGVLKTQFKGMGYYNKAILNEPEVTNHIKRVAEITGMKIEGLDFKIKGKDSFIRKIRKNYNIEGNEYEIKDILRYTYTDIPEELVEKTQKTIVINSNMGYNTIEVKNYWLNKNIPYNGINTIVKTKNGQKFEIQYHTPESFELKNGKLHRLYEAQREISDRTSDEFIRIDDEMYELSDELTVPREIERIKSYGRD